jgi:type I restriction enzyme S subunit
MGVRQGFKQTDLGLIPENWEIATLGSLAVTGSGTTPSRTLEERYFKNGCIPWVKTLDLNNGEIHSTEELVTEFALAETSLTRYPPGTVLIAMYGGFNQIGRLGLLQITATVNQALLAVQPNPDRLDSRFLLHLLNYRVAYWRSVASSSRKDPNITSSDIKNFLLAFPLIGEQKAIARILDLQDNQILRLQQLIAKKRLIKEGVMQRLFRPKDGWVDTTLLGLANGNKALFDDGDWVEAEHLTDQGVRLVQTGNIGIGEFVEVEEKKYIHEKSFESLHCKEIVKGDLLICRLADPAGRACILPDIDEPKTITSVDVTIFRPPASVVNRVFLSYLFSTKQWFRLVNERSGGTTHKRISRGNLGRLKVTIPPLNEQNRIATILHDIDVEVAALRAKLGKSRQMKLGLMQELFTGRIRLVCNPQKATTA